MKIIKLFLVSILIYFISLCVYADTNYRTTQITDDLYNNEAPQINSHGYVVWPSGDSDFEIALYNYLFTAIITHNSYNDWLPQINDNGYITWRGDIGAGAETEIFLFLNDNNYTVIPLTDNNNYNTDPQINNNGYVVWRGFDGADNEIFLYNGSTTTQITDNDYHDFNPQINDSGHLVWAGQVGGNPDGVDFEIFFYNGSTITQLTNNSYHDDLPKINANDYIVYEGYDGTDNEIFLNKGSTTTQITNNDYQDYSPQINDSGHLVWSGFDGTDYEIFLYNGSTTIQITNNDYGDYSPQISNSGHVVWSGEDGTDNEIFLYNGSTTTQITNNDYQDYSPQINDSGHVVWRGFDGTDYEIFSAKPIAPVQHSNTNKLAFTTLSNGQSNIYTCNTDGSDLQKLIGPIDIIWGLSWAPDATEIAYSSKDTNDVTQVYATNYASKAIRQITNEIQDARSPAWSPDGSQIAYILGANSGIFMINAQAFMGTGYSVSTDIDYGSPIAWSPNGNHLVGQGIHSGDGTTIHYDLAFVNKDGSGYEVISFSGYETIHTCNSWNNQNEIVFCGQEPTWYSPIDYDLFYLKADKSGYTTILDDTYKNTTPLWFDNGNKVAFISNKSGYPEIWSINKNGSNAQQLTLLESDIRYLSVVEGTSKAMPWLQLLLLNPPSTVGCGAYVTPGVWKEFDCYNLAAIGKTTNDDPFIPSWRLIGGYWQWGRKGPDATQWYDTNTPNFAHGPTSSDVGDANDEAISGWDTTNASNGSWSDASKTANDPCPAGYRVPTDTQWDGVIANNTHRVTGSWSSNATNYSSARFFGNDLMLPAAANRDGSNGSLGYRGLSGYYWSSYGDTNLASYLYFSDSNVLTVLYYHICGFSVRCVAE